VSQIGVSFTGRNDYPNDAFATNEAAGVVSQTNWNNDTVQVGGTTTNTSSALFNSFGSATGVTLTLTANDSWNSGSGDGSGNAKLLQGIIKEGNPPGTAGNFVFNNVAAAGPGSAWSYKVLAYTMEDGTGGDFSLSLGSTTYYGEAQAGNNYNGTFIQSTTTSLPTTFTVSNYVEFDNVQATNGSISLTYTHLGGSNGVGMAGLQLIQVYTDPNNPLINWTGSSNGLWDGSTQNWQGGSGATAYSNNIGGTGVGNQVVFDDTATGTHNIVIANAGAGVLPDNITVNTQTGYTFSGEAITGPANLTINSGGSLTGAVTLNSANTFTGITTLGGGTLVLGHALALQGSTFNSPAAPGTDSGLRFASGIGSFVVGGLSGTGNINLADAGSQPVNLQVGANNITSNYNGVLGGPGSLTKVGNAALNLTQAQTLTGPVSIKGGTLTLSGPGASLSTASSITLTASGKSALPSFGGDLVPAPVLFIDDGVGADSNHFGTTPIILNGGTIAYHGGASATLGNPSTTLANVTVNTSGFFTAQPQVNGGNIGIINLTINPSATATFESQYGPLGNGSGTTGQVTITNLNGTPIANTNGIIGGWATTASYNNGGSGITGGNTGVTDFATYGPNGITAVSYSGTSITNSTNPADNIIVPAGETVATSTTINSLNDSNTGGTGDLTINGGITLTLGSGGLIMGGANHRITGGGQITAGPGSVTTLGGNYNLFVTINETTFNGNTTDLEINTARVVDNNGTPVNLIKGGLGTLILGGNQGYTGSTIINAGTLQVTTGGQPGTLAGNGPVIINSGATLLSTSTDGLGFNNHTANNSITINPGGTLTVGNNSRLSMDRSITSIGGTMASIGTTFDSNASYTLRDVNGAVYTFTSSPDGTPSTISALNAGLSGTATLHVNRGGGAVDLNVTGNFTDNFGTGNLVRAGNGVMTLSGTSIYTGTTALNGGTTIVLTNAPSGSAGAFGNSTSTIQVSDVAGNTSPTILIGGAFNIGRAITILNQATTGTYGIGGSTDSNSFFSGLITINQPLTVSQVANVSSNALNITGGITAGSGQQTVNIVGPGNINISGTAFTDGGNQLALAISGGNINISAPNSYTGGTTIGTASVKLSGAGSLGASSAPLTVNIGGTIDLNGTNQTVGNFSGNGGAIFNNGSANSVLTLGNNDGTGNFAGSIKDHTSGSAKISVTKIGAGTIALSGANTYSGATTINGGILALAGSSTNNIPFSNTISLNSGTLDVTGLTGGTLSLTALQNLNGAGSIVGSLTTVNGTSLSPGIGTNNLAGTVGTLTISGNQTLGTGTNFNFVIGAPDANNPTTALGIASLVAVNGTLTFPTIGTPADRIVFNPINLQPGFYELFSYGTLANFNPANANSYFKVPSVGSYTFSVQNNQIDVLISLALLKWTGRTGANADSNWTTSTGSVNWLNGAAAASYANGSGVTFDDSATNTIVNIQAAGVTPTSVVFNNSFATYQISDLGANGILGATGVTLNGSGVVDFMGANAFAGGVNINAGILNVSNNAALGNSAGVIVASGGTLQLQSSGSLTTSAAIPLTISGIGAIGSSAALENVSGTNTYTGAITLGSAASVAVDAGTLTLSGGISTAGNALTLSGPGNLAITTSGVSGTGSLNLTGTGVVTFAAGNTYTGATAVTSGTLQLANTNAFGNGGLNTSGVSVATGAALDLNGTAVTAVVPLTIAGTGPTGSGALINSSASPATFSGNINNAGGGDFSVGGDAGSITLNGAAFNVVLDKVGSDTVTLAGTTDDVGLRAVVDGGTLILAKSPSGPGGLNGGVRSVGGGPDALTINNGGTARLAGTGGDQIYDAAGVTVNTGGTFDFNGVNESINSLNGGGTVTNTATGTVSTMTVGANGGGGTFTGVIQDGAGKMAVTKNGNGTLTFNSANTYSGPTNINGGAIQVGHSQALQNTTVAVNANGGLTFATGITTATLGGLAGSGTFTAQDGSGAPVALTIGGNNASSTFTGSMSGGSSLTKVGNGVLTLSGSNTYSGPTVISGGTLRLGGGQLVAQYSFDNINGNTVINGGTGGSSMNGTLVNATVNSGVGPLPGSSSVSFTGNGSVTINSPIESLNSNASWTVSAWIQTTQAGGSILNKGDGSTWAVGYDTFYLGANNTTGTFASAVNNGGGWVTGNTAINDGNWHLVTFVDNAGTKSIYTDGVLNTLTSNGFTGNDSNNAVIVRLGWSPSNDGSAPLTGSLSDVNFFSGALTAAQVQSLFTANTVVPTLPTTTPVSITTAGATLDVSAAVQTIGSLTGVAGSFVTISGGALSIGNDNTNTEFAGSITGNGTIVKVGSGTLTLSGTNTFAGNTTINAGVLQIGNGGATGSLPVNGSITNNATLTFNTSGTSTLTGPISGGGTIIQQGSGTTVLSGTNSMSGQIVVAQGKLAVQPGTFGDGPTTTPLGTSTVTLSGGTLALQGAQNAVAGIAGNFYSSGSALPNVNNADPDFNSLAAINAKYGAAVPTQQFTSTTIGAQTFTNFNLGTTFADPYGNQNFALIFTGKFNAPTSAGTSLYTFNTTSDDGSVLFIDGQMVVSNNFYQGPVTRSGSITLSPGLHDIEIAYYQGGGGYALSAQVQNANLNGGALQNIPDSANAADPGLVSFGGGGFTTTQTYSNAIQVTADSSIDVTGSLTAAVGPLSINGSTLTVSSSDNSGAAYSLTAGATTLTGNATLNVVSSAGFGSGTLILGPVSGGGFGLTKVGDGVLQLTGANTYTGTTNINAGAVVLGPSGSLSGSVAIAHGAGFDVSNLPGAYSIPTGKSLSATGLDSGTSTVTGSIHAVSGSSVAAGGAGQLAVSGTATFDTGATLSITVGKSVAHAGQQPSLTDYGQLAVTGSLSLNNSTLALNVGSGIQTGDVFTIILTGGESGRFAGETLVSGTTYSFTAGGQPFEINYAYNGTAVASAAQFASITGGTQIALLAVPEPASAAMLLGGFGTVLGLARFRRRQ